MPRCPSHTRASVVCFSMWLSYPSSTPHTLRCTLRTQKSGSTTLIRLWLVAHCELWVEMLFTIRSNTLATKATSRGSASKVYFLECSSFKSSSDP